MNQLLNLREKRAKAWDAAKAFLDTKRGNDGLLSAEDVATYEKMEADVVALGKEIDRMERQAAIDRELAAPTNSPLTSRPEKPERDKEGRAAASYCDAFWQQMRNRSSYEVRNALRMGEDAEGGFLVPDEYERTLIDQLAEENVMRGLCHQIRTASGDRKIPLVASKGAASWVEEEGAIPESDDTFGQITLGAHKVASLIKISEELINDAVFDLPAYIAREFARRVGATEEAAFITGDGAGKPMGLLHGTNGAETGVTAASATLITADEVIDLVYALRAPYRRRAVFLMNDATVKALRKLKDANNQYMWAPGLLAGQPDTLLNQRIVTSSYMPLPAAGNKAIAYGDLSHYWIADREGRAFQRLNELYAPNGQVGFRITQRVDGRLILPEAVKVLQMKAS